MVYISKQYGILENEAQKCFPFCYDIQKIYLIKKYQHLLIILVQAETKRSIRTNRLALNQRLQSVSTNTRRHARK